MALETICKDCVLCDDCSDDALSERILSDEASLTVWFDITSETASDACSEVTFEFTADSLDCTGASPHAASEIAITNATTKAGIFFS